MTDLVAIYEAMWCPVCGYQLDFKPWNGPSACDEICPSCGIQFGYDDAGPGDRRKYYRQWRELWQARGSLWWSSHPCPEGYDPKRQLARLNQPD